MTKRRKIARWLSRHWLAVSITTTAAAVLQVLLLLQALSRGLDYLLSPVPPVISAPVLTVVERAIPLHLAGWGFVLAAVAALAGLVLRRLPLAALGHMMIAVLYAVFAAGAVIEVLGRDYPTGWRSATAWAAAAVIHLIFARVSESSWRSARAR